MTEILSLLQNIPPQLDKTTLRQMSQVIFALLPHVDAEDHPESSMAKVERMAAQVPVPTYAIDDHTAIKVVEDKVEVVSEGAWKLFRNER
jgi:dipeptidase E